MATDSKQTAQVENAFRSFTNSVPLFSGLPVSLIDELRKAATFVNVDVDQTILRQGEINKNLYFLVIGTVDVFVDGGLVASLRRKGDLLGEMSVITEKPCSATIVAKTPVELICIDIDQFRNVTGVNKLQFENILYRIYSQILTDKVNTTNQRAKRVEETLQALHRAKNELQEIHSQMELRVVERTSHLQSKLQDLTKNHLAVLRKSLADASVNLDPKFKSFLAKGIDEVDQVVKVVEPLVQMFTLEVSMKNKRVLLAQGERKFQTIAKMALGGTGIHIEVANSLEMAQSRLETEAFDVVLIDSENLELLNFDLKKKSRMQFIYVANRSIEENVSKLNMLKVVPNIVFVWDEDRVGSVRSLMTAVTKLCSTSLFGLERYLNLGVEVREAKVLGSDERRDLNDQMRAHFQGLGVRSSVLDNVSMVLEEILMNAIYDAPADEMGKPIYNHLQRSSSIKLKPHEQSILRYATDGNLLAVSVTDPFGMLGAQTILKYLESCYSGQAGIHQNQKGGAGRGLHLIVQNSLFVVFNSRPKSKTEVIAFFSVTPGAKTDSLPTMHYFVENTP